MGSDGDRNLYFNTNSDIRCSYGLRPEVAAANYHWDLCELRCFELDFSRLIAAKLDTAVSILATVSRASIIFVAASIIAQQKWLKFVRSRDVLSAMLPYDDATRGPMGALSLALVHTSEVR